MKINNKKHKCDCGKVRNCTDTLVADIKNLVNILNEAVSVLDNDADMSLPDDTIEECGCPHYKPKCSVSSKEVDKENYLEGYDIGFPDGKGHKVKRVSKTDGFSRFFTDGYLKGYRDGRNGSFSDSESNWEAYSHAECINTVKSKTPCTITSEYDRGYHCGWDDSKAGMSSSPGDRSEEYIEGYTDGYNEVWKWVNKFEQAF